MVRLPVPEQLESNLLSCYFKLTVNCYPVDYYAKITPSLIRPICPHIVTYYLLTLKLFLTPIYIE